MPFLNELQTTPDKVSGYKSRLIEPLNYESTLFKRVFTVPKGFTTDFASIPRTAQLLIPKMGRHREAATLHDYLYFKSTPYQNMSRKDCDHVFKEAMKEARVSAWKCWSMFSAVRSFGWLAYRK